MPNLTISQLTRRYLSGGGIEDITLSVASGQFLVLLGPSGSGKTTLLRLLAGLDHPDSGTIAIDGAEMRPGRDSRDSVAMVFQNFALYPHMTLFENIAFPLRLRKIAPAEIERRVKEHALKVGLDIDLGRLPRAISGGERQRVALARALVREPDIVLMDEPMASLDAPLRSSLRLELKRLQRTSGLTFVYVTHDQVEALSLADHLAVMREGRIEQDGAPDEIFDRPATEFVARFLGDPPMNVSAAEITADGSVVVDGKRLVELHSKHSAGPATIGFRPGDLRLTPVEGDIAFEVEVESVEFAGTVSILRVRSGSFRFTALTAQRISPCKQMALFLGRNKLHLFDARSGKRLLWN